MSMSMPMPMTRLLASSRFFVPLPLLPNNSRQCRQPVLCAAKTESADRDPRFRMVQDAPSNNNKTNANSNINTNSNSIFTETVVDRITWLPLSLISGQWYL